jgi:hypothetical protein
VSTVLPACAHSTIRHDHTPSPHDNSDFLTHCSLLFQDALFISPSPQTPFSHPSHTISSPSSLYFFEGAERNVFNFQHYSCLYLLYVRLVFRVLRVSTVPSQPLYSYGASFAWPLRHTFRACLAHPISVSFPGAWARESNTLLQLVLYRLQYLYLRQPLPSSLCCACSLLRSVSPNTETRCLDPRLA